MALTKPPVLPAWAETGDKVQPTNAEIQAGWPLSNVPPARQRWNWILNFVANGIRYLTRRGLPDWANDETYEIGDCTRGPDGLSYKALTQNTNKSPAANPTDWELWAFNASGLLGVVDGFLNKNVAGAVDVALTAAEARNGIINLSGAITANINVTVPATARRWTFVNNTTGAFTLTVKTLLGTGYALPQGVPAALYCDGTNVDLQNELGATQSVADDSARLATTSWVRSAMENIATAAGFSYSFTPNGYFKFPNWLAGFIIQWGQVAGGNGTTNSVTFPVAFPVGCLFATATIGAVSGSDFTVRAATVVGISASLFNFNATPATTSSCLWFAIGH